jgi:hypothetical protein
MVREPVGQTGRGAFSFGYFSLGMQRKVTRQQAKPNAYSNETINRKKRK